MKENPFQNRILVPIFATLAAFTWAFAFPFIKLGFAEFAIASGDTGSKTLFAGIRFLLAGIAVLIIAKCMKRSFHIGNVANGLWLVLFSFVNTAAHYFFFYIGLSNSTGSRSAILDALSTFILIILACILFKNERMTARKAAGCVCGLAGILLVNSDSSLLSGGAFTFAGDGMIILSAVSSAFGGILTRIVTRKVDPVFATGMSLALGGLMLTVAGLIMHGSFSAITSHGIIILLALVAVSAIGFFLYNQLICYNPVGKIAIFNSFIPIFGAVLSCLILGEKFSFNYILAGLLVVAGVYVINRQEFGAND